ncbi:MAG: hypothetical protein ACN6OY_18950 [Pseudomonas alloputida]
MDGTAAATADALELLHMNQTALRAAIQELSTEVRERGPVNIHDNAMGAVQALDLNAESIASAIESLRN